MPQCDICRMSEDNPIQYGEFISRDGITVHYYCLLLSTNLLQNGADNEGIAGFLVEDIKKFLPTIGVMGKVRRKCIYCKKLHASVHCKKTKCNAVFHVICGNKNKCQTQFFEQFPSFCHKHIKINDKYPETCTENTICSICLESMGQYDPINCVPSCLMTPECESSGYLWTHTDCMKENAFKAEYTLKCFSCNDYNSKENSYAIMLRMRGIYVPERVSLDEDESESCKDDTFTLANSKCDMHICLISNGLFDENHNSENLIQCNNCGAYGVHTICLRRVGYFEDTYICKNCERGEARTQSVTNENVSKFNKLSTRLCDMRNCASNINLCTESPENKNGTRIKHLIPLPMPHATVNEAKQAALSVLRMDLLFKHYYKSDD